MDLLKSTVALAVVLSLAFIITSCKDSATGPEPGTGNREEHPPEPYSQTTGPGFSANDFLADSAFTTLAVEVDYMEGYAPTQAALDSLHIFLEKRLNKSRITISEPTLIQGKEQGPYSAEEVRNLEEKYRNLYTKTSDSDTLTAYIIILNGKHPEGSVVGFAYYNTSVALFGETIAQISSSGIAPPPREKVEATVLNHEFGHLFGLVNIDGSGTEMQMPHQDEAHGHHCNNTECLMYWTVETTDFFANLVDGSIPALDQNCIQDLQHNGGR